MSTIIFSGKMPFKLYTAYSQADLLRTAGLTLVYAATVKLTLDFFSTNGIVSIIWPPSGIALAALLSGAKKYWPGVFIGVWAGHYIANSRCDISLVIAVSNTLEVLLTLHLIHADGFLLNRSSDYFRLIFSGAAAACISATLGSIMMLLFGTIPPSTWTENLTHWWLGDTLAIAIVTPLLLVWKQFPKHWLKREKWPEILIFWGCAFLTGQIIFLQWPVDLRLYARAFVIFAFIVYAALRFGSHGVLALIAMISVQSLLSAVLRVGYFAADMELTGLINLWFYLLLLSITGITLAFSIERQQLAEAEIKPVSEFNRHIVESIQEGVIVYDVNGCIMLWNHFMERMTGIPASVCLGKRPEDLFPFLRETPILKGIQRALMGDFVDNPPYPWNVQETAKSGWASSTQSPLHDDMGRITGAIEVVSDITHRIRDEQSLKESENRWKFALESGGDGVWDWNLANGKVFLSPRCMEILGFTDQDRDNYYRNWEATIHPDDYPRLVADLKAHLNGDSSRFSNEHRAKQPDGSWKWILTRGLVMNRDSEGKAVRMIGTQTDISERKEAEWLQIKKIVTGSPEAMLLVTESGSIKLANESSARIFGYPLPELIGLNIEILVPHHLRASHKQQRSMFMQAHHARSMASSRTINALHQNGSEFPVEISLTPIAFDNSNMIMASIIDISNRRRIEHETQLMAMIYQAIGEAVMVADADNHIIAVNDAFTRLTGYSEAEVIGQSTSLLKSGRHDRDFYRSMWHSLELTGHWQGEIWNLRKSGSIIHEWLEINTIYGSHGDAERRVALFSEITEQKQAEQTIWRHANFDPLTQLANRRMFHDRLSQEIKKAHRDNKFLALMLLDLDRFKEVNDTLGHGMGDILLQQAAVRIVACVREVDTVARLGGDEFTVILGEIDAPENADRVAQAILQKLSEPFNLGSEQAFVSASIGITYYPADADNQEQLIKNADQSMYAAKLQGRNCYCYFTPAMEKKAQMRMRLINDLRSALSENQFRLYYQGIVGLATGKICKAEALIRWQHPTQGLINPAEFIPLAEETGIINEIGDWVFRSAAQQLAQWRFDLAPDFQVSINMSPVQFRRNHSCHASWFDYINELQLPGHSIMVEITESLLLDIDDNVTGHLYAYRDKGMHVAIDDFGTGYSSLSYLKKFDIDYLKIDKSFVRNLSDGSSDLALCEAIIVMAHTLGLKVVAEGIETQQQRQLLTNAGCDYGQGYIFSKPLPAAEFSELLRNA